MKFAQNIEKYCEFLVKVGSFPDPMACGWHRPAGLYLCVAAQANFIFIFGDLSDYA